MPKKNQSKPEQVKGMFDSASKFIETMGATFEQITTARRPTPAPPATKKYPLSREDPYTVLGVERTDSDDAIRKRYRQLANIYHADKPGGNNAAMVRLNDAITAIKKERGIK